MRDLEPYFNNSLRPFIKGFLDNDFFSTIDRFKNNSMKTDIKENAEEYILTADMPGFDKSQVDIEVYNNVLTIKGTRDEQYNEEGDGYLRKERSYGSVKRSFSLENITEDDISAFYDKGILQITLPKDKLENINSKRIEIKDASNVYIPPEFEVREEKYDVDINEK